MSFTVAKEEYLNVGRAIAMEWLDTNGVGGYASSTALGCHTRKYHGLLVARLDQPAGKFVLLSKVEDSLIYDDKELFLSAHQYHPSIVFPRGYKYLAEFKYKYLPRFRYEIGGTAVRKQIALVQGENTVLIKYQATSNNVGAKLRIKPLIAYRGFHHLAKENLFLRVRTFPVKNGNMMSPYETMPEIFFQTNGNFEFFPSPVWYRNFEYHNERVRGFECLEDLFCPGMFEIDFPEGSEVVFSASTAEQKGDLHAKWEAEYDRRHAEAAHLEGTEMQKTLGQAAAQFFTESRPGQVGITAGWPWFLEWGRDAMISLPGLAMATDNPSRYKQVLDSFAAHQRRGIIPNFLGPTPEENAYNSADASLWFGWAVQQYLRGGGKLADLGPRVVEALCEVLRHYVRGTDFGIRMEKNGLLSVGSPDVQVTWMDAAVGGRPVTPRHGCPVEINALWYNFVSFLADLEAAGQIDLNKEPARLAPKIRDAFVASFWLEEDEYLADVYRDGWRDKAVRPNQIYAVSLPFSPLDLPRAQAVVGKVKKELLTPFGLRTLSPADLDYRGRYEGGPEERDRSYHNGTAWPFLLGAYGEALLKVSENKALAVAEIEKFLEKIEEHLSESGLGSISEVFDGNPPRSPHGCISQAWSVAEIYRLTKLVQTEKERRNNGAPRKGQKRASCAS